MQKRAVIMTIVLFALIVLGMFVYAYLKRAEMVAEPPATQPVTEEEPQEEVKYASITRVDAKHFFADGLHTLVGEIAMPTPCDLLDPQVTVAESMPEQVTVDFQVINTSDMCAQVITPARFKVEAEASKDATFRALIEGREIELNLIPAEPGETPEDFDLYYKG